MNTKESSSPRPVLGDNNHSNMTDRLGFLIGETKSRLDQIDTIAEELKSKRFSGIAFYISMLIVFEIINAAALEYLIPQKVTTIAPLTGVILMVLLVLPLLVRQRTISANLTQISILQRSLEQSNTELSKLSQKDIDTQRDVHERLPLFFKETKDVQDHQQRMLLEVAQDIKQLLEDQNSLKKRINELSFNLQGVDVQYREMRKEIQELTQITHNTDSQVGVCLSDLNVLAQNVQSMDNKIGICLSEIKILHSITGYLREDRVYLIERIDSNFKSADGHFRSLEERQTILSERINALIGKLSTRLLENGK